MTSFNTGDNAALKVGVLRRSYEWLESQGMEYVGALSDIKGSYAYSMKHQGRRFYLVARASHPYNKNGVLYISSQKTLVKNAAEEKRPILVSMWPKHEKKPCFRLFDAVELKRRYAKELLDMGMDNIRWNVRMVNYEWSLGVDLNPLKLWDVFGRMKSDGGDELNFSQLKLETHVPQQMIQCGCGCLYSDRLGFCPNCGVEFCEKEDSP